MTDESRKYFSCLSFNIYTITSFDINEFIHRDCNKQSKLCYTLLSKMGYFSLK